MLMTNPGIALIIITAILAAVSTVTTVLRLLAKVLQRSMQIEDYIILVAWVLLVMELVFVGLEYQSGSGSHINTLSETQVYAVLKYIFATETLIYPVVCLIKVSICFFVLRIKNTRPIRYGLYTMMGFLILTTLLCEIVLFAQCQPLYAYWDRTAGVCWDFDIYNDIVWAFVSMFHQAARERSA